MARSAAPAGMSDSANIYVLTATGYELAVTGANGGACYVSRDWLDSLEPHCFDAEGAGTILPMAMRLVELLHQGRSRDEADREVADGLLDGRFRLPARPVLSYMLSSAAAPRHVDPATTRRRRGGPCRLRGGGRRAAAHRPSAAAVPADGLGRYALFLYVDERFVPRPEAAPSATAG